MGHTKGAVYVSVGGILRKSDNLLLAKIQVGSSSSVNLNARPYSHFRNGDGSSYSSEGSNQIFTSINKRTFESKAHMRSIEQGLMDEVFNYVRELDSPIIVADQKGTASKNPISLISIDDCIDEEDGISLRDKIEWFMNKYASPVKFWSFLDYLDK